MKKCDIYRIRNNVEKHNRTIIEDLIDRHTAIKKARKSIAPGKSWVTKLINGKGVVITSRMGIINKATAFYGNLYSSATSSDSPVYEGNAEQFVESLP